MRFQRFAVGLMAACFLAGCQQPPNPADITIFAFSAKWCGPCQRDKPAVAELDRHFLLAEFDVDIDPVIADQFRVESLPCYVLIVDGKESWRGSDIDELARRLGVGE